VDIFFFVKRTEPIRHELSQEKPGNEKKKIKIKTPYCESKTNGEKSF